MIFRFNRKFKIWNLTVFLLLGATPCFSQVRILKPEILPLPDLDLERLEKIVYLRESELSEQDKELCERAEEEMAHFYSPACSWYCAGIIDTVKASSFLSERYIGQNAHDFSTVNAWVEGVPGSGIGEYLEYTFPASCPRITHVLILNGYIKNKTVWRNNARVKQLLMYYNGEPYAILELDDTRDVQKFDVGLLGFYRPGAKDQSGEPDWTIRFEILEIYPGDKYEDTAITEIYFDGIDDH